MTLPAAPLVFLPGQRSQRKSTRREQGGSPMTRSQRRTSRALVVAVGGTLALGLAVTAVKVGASRNKSAAKELTPRAAVMAAPVVDSGTPKSDAKPGPKLAALPGGAAVLETPT